MQPAAMEVSNTNPNKVEPTELCDKYPFHSYFFPAYPAIVSQSASINTDTERYLFDSYSTKLYWD